MKECIVCKSKMVLHELVDHLNDKLMLVYKIIIAQEEEIKKLKKEIN